MTCIAYKWNRINVKIVAKCCELRKHLPQKLITFNNCKVKFVSIEYKIGFSN